MNAMRSLFLLLLAAPAGVELVSVQNAEHYRWGGCCDGWYLVKNDRLTIIQERMPPGSRETLHLHRMSQQFFYVLEGEATVFIGGKMAVLRTGEGTLVKPGTVHQVRNSAAKNLLLQVTSQPPSHADRVEMSQHNRPRS